MVINLRKEQASDDLSSGSTSNYHFFLKKFRGIFSSYYNLRCLCCNNIYRHDNLCCLYCNNIHRHENLCCLCCNNIHRHTAHHMHIIKLMLMSMKLHETTLHYNNFIFRHLHMYKSV